MVDEKSVQDQHPLDFGRTVSSNVPTLVEAHTGAGGTLEHLKTTLELRAGDALLEVYFTDVPVKSVNNVLKSVLRPK